MKLNLWTLLFLITAGYLAYTTFFLESNSDSQAPETSANCIPTKNCNEIPNFKLNIEDAKQAIDNYQSFLQGQKRVNNPDLRYITLDRCQLAEMLRDIGPDSDLIAHLAVKEKKNSFGVIINEIGLIFEAKKSNSEYYDFGVPCPSSCNK